MRYCKKCVMPDTRPGISFDEEGICTGCQSYALRSSINWDERWKELLKLSEKYKARKSPLGYDCIIAVSGGKDSHYQVYVMKELLGMTPLLVSVEDNFPMTDAGKHNLMNISESFGCELITLKPNIKAQKLLMRYMFERYGKPTWYLDRLIYTYPLHIAAQFDIPLLVYGENVSYEYGGMGAVETYSARDQIDNGVATGVSIDELLTIDGIKQNELFLVEPPNADKLDDLDPIYLSYFVEWNSYRNYNIAKTKGFRDLTHEWDRTHHIENFDQVDSRAYLVHSWLKYPKFGHASATDYASRFVRYGLIDRKEAVKLVREHDHALDQKCIDDFCSFTGYTEAEFWVIIDSFYNRELFIRDKFERWILKNPVE